MDAPDLDTQWADALSGLTEMALTRVTVVAMPPPNAAGRVRSGFGAMLTLTGTLGRLIEPDVRGRDVLQFPLGDAETLMMFGGFGISRPAFRGCSRTPTGWLEIKLDGLHLMIRPAVDMDAEAEAA